MSDNKELPEVDGLLEEYDGVVNSMRNTTEISKLCNKLVVTFMHYKPSIALVRTDKIEYPMDSLYRSLNDVCRKKAFRGRVKACRRDGKLFLLRIEE